jgi:hypothetical protein
MALTRRLTFCHMQKIWDHSGNQRKNQGAAFPGVPDTYRETVYRRDPENTSFRVAYSALPDP